MGWPAIQGYENGEDVKKDVLNRPLNQLAQRTEYLRTLLEANNRSQVTVQAAFDGDMPRKGTPVYQTDDGKFAPASALHAQDKWFYGDDVAMAVGVTGEYVPGDEESVPEVPDREFVVLYGKLDFTYDPDDEEADNVKASELIVDDDPVSGRYFLAEEEGKLTKSPNGPVIYVAHVVINAAGYITRMLVNPQYRDTGESHVHRELVLDGRPMGGKAGRAADGSEWVYSVDGIAPSAGTAGARLEICGTWKSSTRGMPLSVRYASGGVEWKSDGDWSSAEDAGDGTYKVGNIDHCDVRVRLIGASVGNEWAVTLPDDGRRWVNHYVNNGTDEAPNWVHDGFSLNLGFYADTGLVPPNPSNAGSLVVDGLELLSPFHGSAKQWSLDSSVSLGPGGPWLVWHGNRGTGESVVTPFVNGWGPADADVREVAGRHISFHTNRMRVGPDGFVTSLQVEPGSPLRIVDALTGSPALQGALMLGLALDFDTVAHGVPGSEVVKSIRGSKFETGPVVERILEGPGVAVSGNGQGTVRVSVSNAHYAGDFETIALKNAKQDVAGGIFPYTKLLGWTGSGDIPSGFTARFRVPDYLPYGDYNVVVSASVFGEEDASDARTAAFRLTNYVLKDYALAAGTDIPTGSIAAPDKGKDADISVRFTDGYSAFDPVLIHGLVDTDDVQGHRQRVVELLLQDSDGHPITVKPGYFVGIEIARKGFQGDDTPYTAPIGFVSLRWNLVKEVQ